MRQRKDAAHLLRLADKSRPRHGVFTPCEGGPRRKPETMGPFPERPPAAKA